jgi:hypothetical protein
MTFLCLYEIANFIVLHPTGGQPLDVTYYLLREVLKKHTPAIVVVDLFYLGMETPYGETGFISNALDNMKIFNEQTGGHSALYAASRVDFLFIANIKISFSLVVPNGRGFFIR